MWLLQSILLPNVSGLVRYVFYARRRAKGSFKVHKIHWMRWEYSKQPTIQNKGRGKLAFKLLSSKQHVDENKHIVVDLEVSESSALQSCAVTTPILEKFNWEVFDHPLLIFVKPWLTAKQFSLWTEEVARLAKLQD